jgi:hypothetical protein
MEEGVPYLFVGVLVVAHRVIESAQKFFATYLVCASVYEFLYERPDGFIVRNGESVCVAGHSDLLGDTLRTSVPVFSWRRETLKKMGEAHVDVAMNTSDHKEHLRPAL